MPTSCLTKLTLDRVLFYSFIFSAVCTSVHSCPDKGAKKASGCTAGSGLKPTIEELEQARGKLISCACGGDAQSEQYCAMQPESTAMIQIKKQQQQGNLTGRDLTDGIDIPTFDMKITQFAGAPDVPGKERYKYAYPVVWNATLSNCSFSVGDCYGPLKAEECDLIKCENGIVNCPPPEVHKCPEW